MYKQRLVNIFFTCSAKNHSPLYYIILYYIILYYIILYYIILYYIISYHIISYHIISYHIISYHIISYHIISYHIISYHIISYHIISYHIILYYYSAQLSKPCFCFKCSPFFYLKRASIMSEITVLKHNGTNQYSYCYTEQKLEVYSVTILHSRLGHIIIATMKQKMNQ